MKDFALVVFVALTLLACMAAGQQNATDERAGKGD